MAPSNAEVIRKMFDAYVRGDNESALSHFDEDVEWRDQFGHYYGREGVAESVARWVGAWDDLQMDIAELIEAGDDVVLLLKQTGRGRGSGVPIEGVTAWVYSVSDGKISSVRIYPDPDDALRAVGLEP